MPIPYQKILVPLDGSDLAAQAFPHAEEIARGLGAQLILSQIVEAPGGLVVVPAATGTGVSEPGAGRVGAGVVMENDEEHRRAMDEAKAYLERLAASLRRGKIDAEVNINSGDPATRIVDYAEANAVDLIVMSTHGRTGLGRWLYGSVTNKVLQAAPCAVLVVRPTVSSS